MKKLKYFVLSMLSICLLLPIAFADNSAATGAREHRVNNEKGQYPIQLLLRKDNRELLVKAGENKKLGRTHTGFGSPKAHKYVYGETVEVLFRLPENTIVRHTITLGNPWTHKLKVRDNEFVYLNVYHHRYLAPQEEWMYAVVDPYSLS